MTKEYNWEKLKFDTKILSKHFTQMSKRQIKFVVVHHMAIVGNGKGSALETCYNTWQTREASAHYGVDGNLITQFVWDKDYAWATGNNEGNLHGISIEHANSSSGPDWKVSEETWKTGAKLAAYIHLIYKLGRPVKDKTLRKHSSFKATACPGPYLGKEIWDEYVKEAQRVYDNINKENVVLEKKPNVSNTSEERTFIFWNIAGSDTVNGFAKTNKTRGPLIGEYIKQYGFDIFWTCEASQKVLHNGVKKVLGSWVLNSNAKVIWSRNEATKDKLLAKGTLKTSDGTTFKKDKKYGSYVVMETSKGSKYAVLGIHTDHRPSASQSKQTRDIYKQFVKKIEKFNVPKENIVIGGDLNWDKSKKDNPGNSLNEFGYVNRIAGKKTFLNGRSLDVICTYKSSKGITAIHPRQNSKGVNLSDHYPVAVKLKLS